MELERISEKDYKHLYHPPATRTCPRCGGDADLRDNHLAPGYDPRTRRYVCSHCRNEFYYTPKN